MASVYVFHFLLFSHLMLLLSASENEHGNKVECPPSFHCGHLGNITFPFTVTESPHCGLFVISNCDNINPSKPKNIQLENNGKLFWVIRLIHNPPTSANITIQIRDYSFYNLLESKSCEAFSNNYTLPTKFPFGSISISYSQTMFKCNRSLHVKPPKDVHSYTNCSDYDLYYKPSLNRNDRSLSSLGACTMVTLPIKDVADAEDPFTFITSDIITKVQLSHECANCYYLKRGQCHLDNSQKFRCNNATAKNGLRPKVKLAVGLGVGVLGILIIGLLLILILYKRKHATSGEDFHSRNSYFDSPSNLHLESGGVYFEVPIFSYKDLKEATNNFDHTKELGDGGFGTVYHGKLQDGREVAVKRLYEHNYRRVEQFMNEVQILTRLRHTNLVSLYGCTSKHSRQLLLVYEYISNGTIACHLHGGLAKPGLLPWSIRMKIAIETAAALAYLHASDIIHRDVKTNNILLTKNFCVKVADFGLSRLFPTDVTHVSTAPQGTPGYVDPEYHQCYQLTSKSDVYSFGVVLIELISSKPAVDINRSKEEINLSNLAIKKIQQSAISELVDPSLGFCSDNEVKRKIVSVAELAFQCLQRDKELRPSMDEVLNELRKIEAGEDEQEVVEGADAPVAGDSLSIVHTRSTSAEWDEVGLLKNMKQPSSPNTVTDKWESKCTTPNVSG
ncbi:PREDICTED: LEAF RUST 10 DISEASE-RESISTANCE LOCUS RECEPTOR-LIKE PROTEIN KINASE-like 1.1 isoform X1 [Lupinus angustifolius]|uniref:LEAF RUST 10 DISEASE-RESISTANCE LOCUS RECEPTOR-LIKE PROTEIN KINASE-like 1.1 isoform X1 n=1 Tax=Lupinus angustifolius TaxID=3871 RepID=UPI00092FB41E|nr:PREDICTED: LEAF RUST 10 DISEASE-RESISTANCE LOCUS RECEPTOR-LIKE PROTEIN KINASE-like 1.1 isoform X1 [Lupinus angustifolius]